MLPCPPKVRIFLWQLIHQILPTSSFLYHRHVLNSPLCSLCGKIDDANHWLFECTMFDQLRSSITWFNWQDIASLPYFVLKCAVTRFYLKLRVYYGMYGLLGIMLYFEMLQSTLMELLKLQTSCLINI